jgi:hypothetical protein
MPKQKGEFVCMDCGQDFSTGREFSEHFKRAPGSIAVVGCKNRAEMKAELSRAKSAP